MCDSDSESVYSELSLLDWKSRSLPFLVSSDEKQSYTLSALSVTPPKLSPKPHRQAPSDGLLPLLPQKTDSYSRPNSTHSLDCRGNSPVYHLAGRPGSQFIDPETGPFISEHNSVYAEVSTEAIAGNFPYENTYEQIPGHEGSARPKPTSNTHGPLEDIRSRHFLSSWGIKNEKWKRLFPEVKRK
ncbi:hypothetical protein LDENG_00216120 [Lucifuga dentata]|nr:hypothetical protein LDENG_00216120 [Lucifuga dentata]